MGGGVEKTRKSIDQMDTTDAFEDITLSALATMPDQDLDALTFGVVGLDKAGLFSIYSATEARRTGLDRDAVLGKLFFDEVGPCMNNFHGLATLRK